MVDFINIINLQEKVDGSRVLKRAGKRRKKLDILHLAQQHHLRFFSAEEQKNALNGKRQ